MRLTNFLITVSFVFSSRCIQFQPPKVEAVVHHILEDFDEYIKYNGSASPAPAFTIQGANLETRQSTPFWYEQIAHQGISAFGPAGYQVYRNVKDYGAKGTWSPTKLEPTVADKS